MSGTREMRQPPRQGRGNDVTCVTVTTSCGEKKRGKRSFFSSSLEDLEFRDIKERHTEKHIHILLLRERKHFSIP